MKRGILILTTAVVAGCGHEPGHRKQVEQNRTFEAAYREIEKGQAGIETHGWPGFIPRLVSFDAQKMRQRIEKQKQAGELSEERARQLTSETIPAIQDAIQAGVFKKTGTYGKTSTAYRLEQLEKAAEPLGRLAGEVQGRQELAVRSLLAEIAMSQARQLQRKALDQWESIQNTESEVLTDSASLRMALSRAKAYAGVDLSGIVPDLQKVRKGAEQEVEDRQARVQKIQNRIDRLGKKIAAARAKRKKHMKQAAQLKKEAYQAGGQARYDLYVKAASAERQAIQIDARIQILQAKQSRVESKLKIAKVRAAGAKERVERIGSRIKVVRSRAEEVARWSKADRGRANEVASEMLDRLEGMKRRLRKQVIRRLTDGLDRVRKQIERLKQLRKTATGRTKNHASLTLAALLVERGHLQRTLARVRADSLRLVETVEKDAGVAAKRGGQPDPRFSVLDGTLRKRLVSATKWADAVAQKVALTETGQPTFEKATKSFQKASKMLQRAAKGAGSDNLEAAANRLAGAID